MSFISNEDLKKLGEIDGDPCVSIYMPTHKVGKETQQNPIRLKNLISRAETKLVESGVRAPEAQAILQPATDLLDADDFWRGADEGLAIFASSEQFSLYRLPANVDEFLAISNHFHLKPLIPLLGKGSEFFLLCLSQNDVRLFRGERYEMKAVTLGGVPTSLAEALKYDDPEAHQQFHTATSSPGGQGARPAMYHGHGGGSDDEDENILRFCQHVEKGLQSYLQGSNAPLILACVESLYPVYRQANSYPHLIEDHVEGNPEAVSSDELHQQAWNIVEPIFAQDQEKAITRFYELSDTEQISTDIQEIVPAAQYGRVDTLFVAVGQQQWGCFDPDSNSITLQQEPNPQNEDLFNLAAMQTLFNSGTVFALEESEHADLMPLAAIFRY